MSTPEHGSPDYDLDFGAQPYFDELRVAEEVVWPLLDMYFHGNFREESGLSDEVIVRKSAGHQGEQYHVVLHGEHDLMDETDLEEPTGDATIFSTVRLEIETVVEDQRRDMILDLALEADDELEDLEPDELVAKVGVDYIFDTDGDLLISGGFVVENVIGEVQWARASEEPEGMEIDEDELDTILLGTMPVVRLFGHDMQLLETGIYVLDAPVAIMRALRSIRKNPLITKGA